MRIDIKPLSVNDCWTGRRFKTPEYKAYEESLLWILPKKYEIPKGKLKAWYVWGFSSKASDNDNPIKPFQDILQKKYGFNDNRIMRTIVDKHLVPKGEEFIAFQITSL